MAEGPISENVVNTDTGVPPLPSGKSNCNPRDIGFLALIAEDFRTHRCDVLSGGFWALLVHRFGNWRMSVRSRLLRAPFSVIYRISHQLVQWLWGIKLDYNVAVGRRVCIEHFGGMILGARSIGNDVTIRQNTTFGVRYKDRLNCKPIIGNHVDIGCGACLLGHVHIGDESVIGANAVVISDVPANSIAVGVPAVIKPRKLSTSPDNVVKQDA